MIFGLVALSRNSRISPRPRRLFRKAQQLGFGWIHHYQVQPVYTLDRDSRDDVGNANYRYGMNIDVKNRDISGTILITSYLIMANQPDKQQKNEKSQLVNVDNPIDTKRIQKTKGLKYPSKIDLDMFGPVGGIPFAKIMLLRKVRSVFSMGFTVVTTL